MLLLKGDHPSKLGEPGQDLIAAMIKYQEEIQRAGVLLAAEGLFPSALGSRVVYRAGERRVVDGPFPEAKELVAGFYLIDVRSKEEAIEWACRVPVEHAVHGDQEAVVEVRRVAEADDLDAITEEQRAAEQRLRDERARKATTR